MPYIALTRPEMEEILAFLPKESPLRKRLADQAIWMYDSGDRTPPEEMYEEGN